VPLDRDHTFAVASVPISLILSLWGTLCGPVSFLLRRPYQIVNPKKLNENKSYYPIKKICTEVVRSDHVTGTSKFQKFGALGNQILSLSLSSCKACPAKRVSRILSLSRRVHQLFEELPSQIEALCPSINFLPALTNTAMIDEM
jgi:hypothetical protein